MNVEATRLPAGMLLSVILYATWPNSYTCFSIATIPWNKRIRYWLVRRWYRNWMEFWGPSWSNIRNNCERADLLLPLSSLLSLLSLLFFFLELETFSAGPLSLNFVHITFWQDGVFLYSSFFTRICCCLSCSLGWYHLLWFLTFHLLLYSWYVYAWYR